MPGDPPEADEVKGLELDCDNGWHQDVGLAGDGNKMPPAFVRLETDLVAAGDDEEEPHDGEEPQQPYPTATLEDLFQWPSAFIGLISDRLPADALESLLQAFHKGMLVSTDYSGIGAPEHALELIQGALEQAHGNVGQGFSMIRCSDKLQHCRSVLLAQTQAQGGNTRCCFGDLLDRMPSKVKSSVEAELDKAKTESMAAAPKKRRSQTTVKECGDKFVDAAFRCLDAIAPDELAQLREKTTAKCFQHEGSFCKVFSNSDPGNRDRRLRINVSGVNCYDWSSMGSTSGWLGSSSVCFVQWVLERKIEQEDIIVAECVERFPHAVLEKALGNDYDLAVLTFDPRLLGKPYARRRKYMVLTRRARAKWHSWVDEQGHMSVFRNTFRLPVTATAAIFFRAPKPMVDQAIVDIASKRGLPARRKSGQPWSYFQVAPPGLRARIETVEAQAFQELAQEHGVGPEEIQEGYDFTFDASQTQRFTKGSAHCPALLQRSQMYSRSKRRVQLPVEVAEVHGFNMFGGPGLQQCPFKSALEALSESQLRKVIGNGMDIPSVGAVLLFCLAGLQVQSPRSPVGA